MIESSGEKSSEVLPKDISGLIDSTFLFKIESNTNNDTKFERNYRVKKICNTEEIILKFKETESNTNFNMLYRKGLKLSLIGFNVT
ncbi:DNA helicase [Trifolium repens]|nr:DNA helicase [Trifolium repens]